MHISCLPTAPLHLKSLGKVAVTRVGSGTGPIGSFTVTPTLGSFWARAAQPPTPTPIPTHTPKAILMTERIVSLPGNYVAERIGRNRDKPQRAPPCCSPSQMQRRRRF